jgi:hypothetical protein
MLGRRMSNFQITLITIYFMISLLGTIVCIDGDYSMDDTAAWFLLWPIVLLKSAIKGLLS